MLVDARRLCLTLTFRIYVRAGEASFYLPLALALWSRNTLARQQMRVKEMSADRKYYAVVLLLLLLSIGAFAPRGASAQQAALQATAARKNLDDCFYRSVAEQLKSSRTTDYDMVSETAFQACSTEEQAIGFLLTSNNVQRETVNALLIRIKLDLKKTIRDIAADPNRYLK